jgi:LmbE family N-acetylglucosaminyl deacetylase
MSPPVAIAVAPHPDDEILGAGATLMALRDAGWRIVTLACSLGRPADHERRRRELTEACRVAGFELVIAREAPPIGADDDLALAQTELARIIVELAARTEAGLIVGPSPHDGHHGHEVVGRAIADAVESRGQPSWLMFWALWGEGPLASLLVPFGTDRLAELQHALAAHAGELARNPYDRLLDARATANAVLGAERVFGFGAPGGDDLYAELLTEITWSPSGRWRLAEPRRFDPSRPPPIGKGPEVGWWLRAPSARSLLADGRRPAARPPRTPRPS